MTEANGATVVLPGTHRDAPQTPQPGDMDLPETALPHAKRVLVTCPAGSAVLFHVNILHGGGANRSDAPRRNVISIWSGPGTYPTTPARYAYQGVMPRSTDPSRKEQIKMSFA
jgi:ectoine hydroxylase-related dioxygenase (phytanoyl-CoA dioxygenase family)